MYNGSKGRPMRPKFRAWAILKGDLRMKDRQDKGSFMKNGLKINNATRFLKRLLAVGLITPMMFAAGCKGLDEPPITPPTPPPPPKTTAEILLEKATKLEGTVSRTDGASAYSIGLGNWQDVLNANNNDLSDGTSILDGSLTCKVIFVNGNGINDHNIEKYTELTNINTNRAGIFVIECPDHEGKYIIINDSRADKERPGNSVRRSLMDINSEHNAQRLPRTQAMALEDAKKSLLAGSALGNIKSQH